MAVTAQTVVRPLRPIPNGAKRGFNRIGRSKTLPVMSGKLVERQQLRSIVLQTRRRLRILRLIDLQKDIEGLSAVALVSVRQLSWNAYLALGYTLFSSTFKALRVLWHRQGNWCVVR